MILLITTASISTGELYTRRGGRGGGGGGGVIEHTLRGSIVQQCREIAEMWKFFFR